MHVVGVEARAREHRGHFRLAVDALLAQHRDRRPRAARNVTAPRHPPPDRSSRRRAGPDRARPASREYSSRAHSGLSRSACMRNDTSLQRRCRSMRDAEYDRPPIGARRCTRAAGRRFADVALQLSRARGARECSSASATRAAGICSTAPSSSAKHAAIDIRDARRSRCRVRNVRQRPSPAASPAGRRRSGRDRRAASRGPSVRAPRRRTRAAAPGSSRSAGSPPLARTPAPSTNRPDDSCRAPRSISSRREGCAQIEFRRQRAARVRDRRERRDDQRHRRDHRVLAVRVGPRGAHRQRILAHRNRDAEFGAQLHADRAHRGVQIRILAGLAAGRHPVGRQADVGERANVRREDIGDRLGDREAARGRRIEHAPPARARPWPWPRRCSPR